MASVTENDVPRTEVSRTRNKTEQCTLMAIFRREPDKGAAIQDVQMSGHTIRESLARGYGDRQGTVKTTCLNVHKARDGERHSSFFLWHIVSQP